jgi:hypothetical protein
MDSAVGEDRSQDPDGKEDAQETVMICFANSGFIS